MEQPISNALHVLGNHMRKPSVSDSIPEMLPWVELGAVRRETYQADIAAWNPETASAVPTGSIGKREDELVGVPVKTPLEETSVVGDKV